MKQYVIDELRLEDYEKLKAYLAETFQGDVVQGIYWIPIDPERLSDTQAAHADCQPFFFALELQPSQLACELLVRTKSRIRCNCIGYATQKQRDWLIDSVDAVVEKLGIIT